MAATNVYVGNLPPTFSDSVLRSYFEGYGNIVSHRLATDAAGANKGYGFVQFSHPHEAALAIATLNGITADGNELVVKLADRTKGGNHAAAAAIKSIPRATYASYAPLSAAPSASAGDNVYVSGMPPDWTEADLNVVFGSCGPIVSCVVLKDKLTGLGRGAGLVRFQSASFANQAISQMNGRPIEGTGRVLEVRPADRPEEKTAKRIAHTLKVTASVPLTRYSPYTPKPIMPASTPMMGGTMAALSRIQVPGMGHMGSAQGVVVPKRADVVPEEGANLHIFGLDNNTTNLNLYEAFAPYGAILSVRVMTDRVTRQPKGFGFVQFLSAGDAYTAMAALDGAQIGSKAWKVSVHKKKEAAV